MIDNKSDDKITKGSKPLPQNNSETITNEHDKEIPKGRYIYIYIYIKKDRKVLSEQHW